MTTARRSKKPIPVHPEIVAEIVGRTVSPFQRPVSTLAARTVDWTQPDYAFWSRLRRGKEPGYELGGLFAKRIAEIDAEWTLGRGLTLLTDNPDLDEEFSKYYNH